jgi:hypothetical protein
MKLNKLMALISKRQGEEVIQSENSDLYLIDATGGFVVQAYDKYDHPRIYTSHPSQHFLDEVRKEGWRLEAWDRWERINQGQPFDVTFA